MPIVGITHSSRRTVPNAPTIGTATDSGAAGANGRAFNNGAVSVTFTAPSYDGGLPITSYRVTASTGQFQDGASSPITVTGLSSSTAPTYTVTATNAVGPSSASQPSNAPTVTTVPQAPTIGSVSAGVQSASVPFTANGTGGKAITLFTATGSPGGSGTNTVSPISVTGLTAGQPYTFTVTATNGNGTSLASGVGGPVTPSAPGPNFVAPNFVVPNFPAFVAPNFPNFVAPNFPNFVAPNFPNFVTPAFPNFVTPAFPNFVAPNFPAFVAPNFPAFVAPNFPNFTCTPCCQDTGGYYCCGSFQLDACWYQYDPCCGTACGIRYENFACG